MPYKMRPAICVDTIYHANKNIHYEIGKVWKSLIYNIIIVIFPF